LDERAASLNERNRDVFTSYRGGDCSVASSSATQTMPLFSFLTFTTSLALIIAPNSAFDPLM